VKFGVHAVYDKINLLKKFGLNWTLIDCSLLILCLLWINKYTQNDFINHYKLMSGFWIDC